MAITKLTMSGFKPSTYNKYDDFLAGNAAYDPAATWLIASATGTGSSTTITFSSIPSTYTSLQIRIFAKETDTSSAYTSDIYIRFNGDTGANYAYHYLSGNGGSATASGAASQTSGIIWNVTTSSAAAVAGIHGTGIVDIHDYASTTRNKTVRSFTGVDKNGSGSTSLSSSLWNSTSAITSITLTSATPSNFTTTTKVALYGMIGS